MKIEGITQLAGYFRGQTDIEFAVLFGSQAQGKSSCLSDIDLAVCLRETEGRLAAAERQLDITGRIMEMYHANRVDVIVVNFANPFLKFQVFRTGRLIYARDEKLFYRYKAAAFGAYQDIKYMYDLYYRKARKDLLRGMHG